MSDITVRDRRILMAHKVFEFERAFLKSKYVAARVQHSALEDINKKRLIYQEAVASVVGCKVQELQFSDSVCCFATKLIQHCVWDIRSRWPCCVFCGGPRDGL